MAVQIWFMTLVDVDALDVIGSIILCASTPQEAGEKAKTAWKEQGLISDDSGKKYHLNGVIMGVVPGTGGQVIIPSASVAKQLIEVKG